MVVFISQRLTEHVYDSTQVFEIGERDESDRGRERVRSLFPGLSPVSFFGYLFVQKAKHFSDLDVGVFIVSLGSDSYA